MSSFLNSEYFFWIILIAMGAYIAYYLYSTIKFVVKNQKARAEYLKRSKEGTVKSYNQYWNWVALYGVFICYCMFSVLTVTDAQEQAGWFRMAFFFVGMILLGQLLIAIVKRRILIGPDGFVYEDGFNRWQSVLRMEAKKKTFMRIVEVLTTNNKNYTLPPKLGKILHDEYEAYRAAKKNKKGK